MVAKESLPWLSFLWCAAACCVAFVLQYVTAWYSRFFAGWSALHVIVPGRVGWCLMESVSLLALCASYALHGGGLLPPLPLVLWAVHYCFRSFVYPFTRFLKPLPLEVVLFASFFNTVNGLLNGASLAYHGTASSQLLAAVGAACWALGFAGNVHSDEVVRRLRRSKEDKDSYKIPPPHGMHRFLTSPNYSCEAFEWFGLWLATGLRPAALSFFVWTLANLVPHAVANRRWYVSKFGDAYPKERKIFVPFIW